MTLNQLTAHEAINLIKKKRITAYEIMQDIFNQIDKVDNLIKAFLVINREEALKQAKEIDIKVKNGEKLPPLAGVTVAVKDIIATRGTETTCGSKILKGFIPPYNATVINRLKEAGAIIIGKTNMDEFAMGSSTENSAFGPTRNPWDLERVPGGSSGGSAAAVAADETIVALGTDTGGSIRQPASLCGMVGLKPTYGRVSRYGLIAYASSLDQIGPITKDVIDCALIMKVISGIDSHDSTSANLPVPDYINSCREGIEDLRIGVPQEYFIEGIDQEVKIAIERTLKLFESLGAKVEEVSLPHTEYSLPAYYLIATAEASSNLARYDGVQYGYRADNYKDLSFMYKKTRSEGFGNEVKRRIMLGTYALSSGYYDAYYLKAQKVRTLIKEDFDKAFEKYDILITPTSPTPAFKLNEKVADPLTMYLSDIYTIPVNLAGIPAISLNCGYSKSNLPIGLQIIGKHFSEETILRAAFNFEQNNEIEKKKPEISPARCKEEA
ncbi:Asp-tRNA(Asn)/Glu-tRNA(Gln) amidotransferase subunit GatA [bacterium]|nr:Asp-tRNA(Asn)/Glu-tRNA(Gln) amidotransferase subunit GatA [bacterium]MBU4361797.1 Asp-tRNA(Asn)/Glu-tRNA(Gln) amidotransferase subunit GatA [bacterium]MBU4602430.1 Asp-tRNA(Asn)/Glu-tRNA(Gln) amidotransferase subunit GatA [bacterium]MCG2762190.1 Asp-tRNA(Asn)/Glu-tRNA(Gln) amidotransferase subunit GatA [Candidatus Atribacteria bacterium]